MLKDGILISVNISVMFKISKKNEAEVFVHNIDRGALAELNDYFTFYVDGYKFIPSFRNKMWDGKYRLFCQRTCTLPYGLLGEVIDFAKKRGYEYNIDSSLYTSRPSRDDVTNYINDLTLTSRGERIIPHDYQIDAVCSALTCGRMLIVSPTGSGKSLIIYLMIRWFLEHHEEQICVIVPTTSLVEQLAKDFADYSSNDPDFDDETLVHKIYSGKEKVSPTSRINITTWQSAITCQPSWFLKYGMIVGDEAHLFKAKSLNKIMSTSVNAYVRVGTTGTLDGIACNERVLIGNFGPVYRVTTTKALINNKTLSELKINCIILDYDDALKKVVSKLDYASEINVIIEHSQRNRFIANLAATQKGNTLVLFNFVEKHGKPLHALIKDVAKDRNVYYVSGETQVSDRERIRAAVEKDDRAIIVASSATYSTGINIRNLHNIIFAAPTKSQIKILQSIGRGLRISDSGQHTTVYDIADDFSWKKKKNYGLKHAAERVSIYTKEDFDIKIYKINI